MTAYWGTASYPSDDGTTYNKRLSRPHFTASGLAAGVAGQPIYPSRWRPRLVHGVDSTGLKHASVPVAVDSGLFTGDTATFTIGATTYNVTGRDGEERPNLAAPFA